jgi:chaperone protein EcpD
MKVLSRAVLGASLVALSAPGCIHAGITINGTRVVYPSDQREVSLSMTNDGTETRLLQAWVDSGDASERPDTSKAPFLITPPMTRVDPGKGQTLRILYTGNHLPQDRESVFWLNVLEIPPKPKIGPDESYLQMAVRTRIKLFYRPAGLAGTPDAAFKQVQWRVSQSGDEYSVECTNNSPYTVSLSDATFKGSPLVRAIGRGGMCPAKGKGTVPVAGLPDADNKLVITVINDFGGFSTREVDYSR